MIDLVETGFPFRRHRLNRVAFHVGSVPELLADPISTGPYIIYCKLCKAMLEIRNRPLLDTLVDSELFVAPDELRRIDAGLRQRLNIIVFGARGSGKTTLLRQLTRQLREQDCAAVFVNVDHAGDASDVLDAVRTALPDAPTVSGEPYRSERPANSASAIDFARALVLDDYEPIVVLLDGVSADAGHELFGRLRDVLWQTPITWVVAARDDERGILAPPADTFFEQRIELEPMPPGQIAQLLRLRLGPNADRIPIDDVAGSSDGNPRRALELAREVLLDRQSLGQILQARAQREAFASTLGRASSMLLTEIEQLDRPVWSSDQELLDRMGWTRNRAVQVLGNLEDVGLLTSYTDRGPEGGQAKMFIVNRQWRPT